MLIDVRTADEFAEGALPGAVRVETPDLPDTSVPRRPPKTRPSSSIAVAADALRPPGRSRGLGYSRIVNAGAYETLAPAFSPD